MGEFFHAIDTKGRIVIPAKFRDSFPQDLLVVTKGFEGCLNVYTQERFQLIASNLELLPSTKKMARDYIRSFLSKAIECDIDSQNRINISSSLVQIAQLTKQCVFIGANDHIELWAKEKWLDYSNSIDATFEDIAETITEFLL